MKDLSEGRWSPLAGYPRPVALRPPDNLREIVDWLVKRVNWYRGYFFDVYGDLPDEYLGELVATLPAWFHHGEREGEDRQATAKQTQMRYIHVLVSAMRRKLDELGISDYPLWDSGDFEPDDYFHRADLYFSELLKFLRAAVQPNVNPPPHGSASVSRLGQKTFSTIIPDLRAEVESAKNEIRRMLADLPRLSEKATAGGDDAEKALQGWTFYVNAAVTSMELLADHFGIGRQAVPKPWMKLLTSPDAARKFLRDALAWIGQEAKRFFGVPAMSAKQEQENMQFGDSALTGNTPSGAAFAAKPATTNQRMLEMIQKNPEARNWTITQWLKELGTKSRATVHGTETWKELQKAREEAKRARQGEEWDRVRRRHNGPNTGER
jgi:hypothetical protein